MIEQRQPTAEEYRNNYIRALEVIAEVGENVVQQLVTQAVGQAEELTYDAAVVLPNLILEEAEDLTYTAAEAAPREAAYKREGVVRYKKQ